MNDFACTEVWEARQTPCLSSCCGQLIIFIFQDETTWCMSAGLTLDVVRISLSMLPSNGAGTPVELIWSTSVQGCLGCLCQSCHAWTDLPDLFSRQAIRIISRANSIPTLSSPKSARICILPLHWMIWQRDLSTRATIRYSTILWESNRYKRNSSQ